MRRATSPHKIVLSVLLAASLACNALGVDAPVYPILSGLDFIGRLHLLAQSPRKPAYTRATPELIEKIADMLRTFRDEKKNVDTLHTLVNQLLAGTAHDQCLGQFYSGNLFVFNYLDSITYLDIDRKQALGRLVNLVSGQENLPKMTVLALTGAVAGKHTRLASESLSAVDLDPEVAPQDPLRPTNGPEHVNLRCFAEGALQGFDMNYDNFKKEAPLMVQTGVKVLVEELLRRSQGRPEPSCIPEHRFELEAVFDRFVQFEVSLYRLESEVRRVEGLDDKHGKRFLKDWRREYLQFQENLRELKQYIFSELTLESATWEIQASKAVETLTATNVSRRKHVEKKFAELKQSFDAKRGKGEFVRLVRKSEHLFAVFEERITTIVREYREVFVQGRVRLHADYSEALDRRAMQLNQLFWSVTGFDFRPKAKEECEEDYLKYLSEARENASQTLEQELGDKDKWLVPVEERSFQTLIQSFLERRAEVSRLVVGIWEEFEVQLEMIWETELGPPDDFFACFDPVREWLDQLYAEFLGLEIQRKVVVQEVLKRLPAGVNREAAAEQVQAKYSTVLEIVRNFKAGVDKAIWRKLRGSMDNAYSALEAWALLVSEMKNQWNGRTERMKTRLLEKGLLLQDVQNAVRKHDQWLEEVELGDRQLRESEFRVYYGVLRGLRRKVRGVFVRLAKDINLLLWTQLLEYEHSTESFDAFVARLKTELEKMKPEIHLKTLKEELIESDLAIRDMREEIVQKHVEYWSQALIDNEQFWYKLGEAIDSGNSEPEPVVNRLVCHEGTLVSKARQPVDLETVYREFISNELKLDSVVGLINAQDGGPSMEEEEVDWKDQYAPRFAELVELLREWKARQFEEALGVFLDHEAQFERFSLAYSKTVEKYLSLWRTTESEFKAQWLQMNDSSSSIERLTRLLEHQKARWDLKFQENDKFVALLMGKLVVFRVRLRRVFLKFSRQMNALLYNLLVREFKSIRDWSAPLEALESLWARVLRQIEEELFGVSEDFQAELGEVYGEIEVDLTRDLTLIDQSLDVEFRERLPELEEALGQLQPESPGPTPLPEFTCPPRTMEGLRNPLERTLHVMISDEIRLSALRRFISMLRLDSWLDLGNRVERVHTEWVEMNRGYKAELLDRVARQVLESNSRVVELLEAWDARIGESLEKWATRSRAQVEDHVLEEDSTDLIAQIKVRTEDYFRAALELDEQLKNVHFGSYLDRVDGAEAELHLGGLKVSRTINEQYLEEWREMAFMLRKLPRMTKQSLEDFFQRIVRNLGLWLEQDSPVIESGALEESITKEIEIILAKAARIETDHVRLWELLDKKFNLTGPDGSLEEFWDEQGNCDIFKIMRLPEGRLEAD